MLSQPCKSKAYWFPATLSTFILSSGLLLDGFGLPFPDEQLVVAHNAP
jgi:hypothetical protein